MGIGSDGRTAHTPLSIALVSVVLVLGACASSTKTARMQDVDSQHQRQLWRFATRAAHGDVATAEAVRSTHARAVRVTMGDVVHGNQPVWVIQVRGSKEFVCNACSRPPGVPAQRGRFLLFVLNATTFQTLDDGIGSARADLDQLGTVIHLHG